MIATEVQRPHKAEANLQPPTEEVPIKPGLGSEALGGKMPSSVPKSNAADAVVFKNDAINGDRNAHSANSLETEAPREAPTGNEHLETISGAALPRNEKAEAFSEARKERVELEATAYLDSEIRKVNARAQTGQLLAEKKRMHEEAKALEMKKREELRAEQLQSNAEVKADKIVEAAKQEATKVKAYAHEQTERAIADADARAEREKAAEEEQRRNGIAELVDQVEQMKATGEFPRDHEKKGVISRLKEKVTGHL